jgi:hypothetical protein
MVDAGVAWTALGTLVSGVGVAVAWRQLTLPGADPPTGRSGSRFHLDGLSVLAPTGRLPSKVRGRDGVLRDLVRFARRPPGEFVVLSGMGGVGKSTIAAALAERVGGRGRGWRRADVWWVSATDSSSLGRPRVFRTAG